MNILDKSRIKVLPSLDSWELAVRESVSLLELEGYVTKEYIVNIFDNINKIGPYIRLCDEVIMPHSRPKDGALKNGISLLKLEKSLSFFGSNPRLFISLSAVDSNSHIDYISAISNVISDDEILNNIIKSNDIDYIFTLFNSFKTG